MSAERQILHEVRPNRPRVALVLGGGGARGIAHILMLEALDELGLKPALILGTSIGAIYGAAYAAGLSARLIRAHTEEALSQRLGMVRHLISARADAVDKLFNFLPLRLALLKPETLLGLVLPSRMPATFAELEIPFAAVATDFYAQEAAVLAKGELKPAIAASMALPGIFQPVFVEGRAMVDGGLVNPLPFDLVGGRADITVAVDVSGAAHQAHPAAVPGPLEALFASSQILQRTIVREKLRHARPDIWVDVDVDPFHMLEFHRFAEILKAGEPAKERLKRELAQRLGLDLAHADLAQPEIVLPEPPKKKRRLAVGRRKKKGA